MVLTETKERDNILIKFLLGRNANDNHEIIDNSYPDSLWFHLSDVPSGHCILYLEPKKLESEINFSINLSELYPSNEDIYYAASLVKAYSKCKNNKNTKVIYCCVNNIKKGKSKGEVIIKDMNKTKFVIV